MSDPDGPWPDRSHLTALLTEHTGAVPALLSLLAAGGAAAFATLAPEMPRTSLARALRWLAAEDLVRVDGGGGTLDAVAAGSVFRLTALGTALAASIAGLAALLEPLPRSRRWLRRTQRPMRTFRDLLQ